MDRTEFVLIFLLSLSPFLSPSHLPYGPLSRTKCWQAPSHLCDFLSLCVSVYEIRRADGEQGSLQSFIFKLNSYLTYQSDGRLRTDTNNDFLIHIINS